LYLEIFVRKKKMRRDKKEIEQSKQHTLVSHYRAIGPAAIVAALLHTTKAQKPSQKFILPRAA